MRHLLVFFILLNTLELSASDNGWHGFCIIERDDARICSPHRPRTRDFSNYCDSFAREEQAYAWRAQFFNSLDFLQSSIPDYCDQVRDGGNGQFFACLSESLCLEQEQPLRRHLASKVYAQDQSRALNACFDKEESRYERELKSQSQQGCFTRIVVEAIE
jgi:hypothetical protein